MTTDRRASLNSYLFQWLVITNGLLTYHLLGQLKIRLYSSFVWVKASSIGSSLPTHIKGLSPRWRSGAYQIITSKNGAGQHVLCYHRPRDVQSDMSSDDAYSSFLDQANQDTGVSKASSKSESVTTKAVDTDVPVSLKKVEQYYTSEADEPFEPVSLSWDGRAMPSESKS